MEYICLVYSKQSFGELNPKRLKSTNLNFHFNYCKNAYVFDKNKQVIILIDNEKLIIDDEDLIFDNLD